MKMRLTAKIGPLDSMAGNIRTLPAIARPVKSEQARQDMEKNGSPKRKFNSSVTAGDRHFEALRLEAKKGPERRPCNILASDWPICHMRCYHRPRCWAAVAADLQINVWE